MTYIWPIMIVFSFVCAIFTGNMENLSSNILSSGSNAITLAIKLTGIICLWNGILNICEKSGLTKSLCKLLSPVLRVLFPTLKDEKTKQAIAMNMTANILGLDNAATPLGLQAMSRLQNLNERKDIASDNMVRFVVINTASIRLISTTVATLRGAYGSVSPTDIIPAALLTSAISVCVGLLMTEILRRFFK